MHWDGELLISGISPSQFMNSGKIFDSAWTKYNAHRNKQYQLNKYAGKLFAFKY